MNSNLKVNNNQIQTYLHNSAYFENMNTKDLIYRDSRCISHDHCKKLYIDGLRDLTQNEHEYVRNLVRKVDQALKPYHKISSIPWKFMIFTSVENDMPHTHADIIFLPPRFFDASSYPESLALNTLIHEKVHVYQRHFPLETNLLFTKYWKYSIASIQKPQDGRSYRSNPDITKILYKDDNNQLIIPAYKPDSSSIRDIIDRRDHPYEIMAYLIPEMILSHQEYPTRQGLELMTRQWMISYL